jgi:hypothetical protein
MAMGVSPVMVINANGTGTMGGDPVDSWKVKGSELKMDYSGVESIVKWSISGNTLTLSYPSDTSTIGMGNLLIAYSPLTKQEGGGPGGNTPGVDNPGGNNPVLTLTSVTASPTSSPTGNLVPYLFLGFNISAGISINDITISGVNGITKSGYLYDQSYGGGTSYILGLRTEPKTSGTITVSVTKSGKAVNGSPKTVYVYNNSNSVYP